MRPRCTRRRGQSAVEAVLVLLVFLATLIGIFDLGQILFVHQTFVARVRSAARYGVLDPTNVAAIKNMAVFGNPDSGGTGIFGLTPAMVSVTRTGNGTSEDRLVVSITGYPYRLFSPWIGKAFTGRAIAASYPVETP